MRAGGRSLKRVFPATGLDEIKGEREEKGGEGSRAEGRPQRPELLQAFDWSGEGGAMEMRGTHSGRGGSLGGASVTWRGRGLQCCCQCHSRSLGTGKKAAVAGGRVASKLKL